MFKWLDKYFTFTKGERNAVIALVFLCFAALLAPAIYKWVKPVQHADDSKYKKELEAFRSADSLDMAEEDAMPPVPADSNTVTVDSVPHSKKQVKRVAGYFDFDPNKIGIAEWVKLGFTKKQAQVIENYKAKGGKFYRPENLMRIYVMDEAHYNKLLPYVKIDTAALPKRNYKRY